MHAIHKGGKQMIFRSEENRFRRASGQISRIVVLAFLQIRDRCADIVTETSQPGEQNFVSFERDILGSDSGTASGRLDAQGSQANAGRK